MRYVTLKMQASAKIANSDDQIMKFHLFLNILPLILDMTIGIIKPKNKDRKQAPNTALPINQNIWFTAFYGSLDQIEHV
jgi:hypothetical protein